VLWVHHEAEELRVHYRATIPEMTARHVIVDLLASGQVARMNAGWLVTRPPDSRQGFSGTVCQEGEGGLIWPSSSMTAISSFRSRDEPRLPGAIVVPVPQ
jgi:hypothetical protein